jgi:ZIP family zinc transporter
MSVERVALLGAIAGFTIFLGLPLGRVRAVSARRMAWLSALAAGILLFIFWDVMSAVHTVLEDRLGQARAGGSWTPFVAAAGMAALGIAVGALGLGWLERAMLRRRPLPPIAGGSDHAGDLGVSAPDLTTQANRAALTLGMLIAVAIGLHNFSEGLAIGVSAHTGEIGLAGTLIIGFALHNATEGFGIVGPLGSVRPSWRWLFLAGLIGGGPTFLGTLVGYRVSSQPLEVAFFALAAGAILFVIGQIWPAASRRLPSHLVLAGLVAGFLIGLASDLVITYGGG